MKSWLRDVFLRYLIVSVPTCLITTRAVPGMVKILFVYALLAAFLLSVRQRLGRGPLTAALGPYRGDPATILWLTTAGYFLLIMAVRLPIYASVQQIWEKTPIIVLVLSSVLLWEHCRPADFGLQADNWKRQAATGAVLFAVAWIGVAVGFLAREIAFIGLPQPVLSASLASVAFNFLMFSYGNFAEELFFRGYVQTKFRRRFGAATAIVLQAVMFSLYHVNYRIFPAFDLPGLILYLWFTFTFGIVMGIIVERTRGLIAPTIVHIGYNMTWPGGLLYLGYRSAGPFRETMVSAAFPWFVFLLFTVPLTVYALGRMGYHRRPEAGEEAETAGARAG